MLKVLINEEEVLTNKDFTIKKEMLNTPSVILNNVYPKSWEDEKDYTSNFYHPQDYSKCKIIDESIVPADPGQTQTGTSFTINDNDSTKLNELTELDGNTTQSGTPTPSSPQPINVVSGRQEVDIVGKNKFDKSNITFYANNTSTFIPSTSDTNNTRERTTSFSVSKSGIKANTTYKISGMPTGWQLLGVGTFTSYGGTNTSQSSTNINNGTFSITSSAVEYIYLLFRNDSSTSVATELFNNANIQIEEGTTETTFEEFKGQSYEINLGKNLFIPTLKVDNTNIQTIRCSVSLNDDEYTFSATGSDCYFGNIIASGSPYNNLYGTLYNISGIKNLVFKPTNSAFNKNFVCFYDKDKVSLGYSQINNSTGLITPVNNAVYIGFRIGISNSVSGTDYTTKIQLEKGSQATSYSPYKTPIELCKIGNYKDRIYKENGTWYLHKEIGKVVLDGSESWKLRNDVPTTSGYYTFQNLDYRAGELITNGSGYSNYFEIVNGSNNTKNNIRFINSNYYGTQICIDGTIAQTAQALKTWLSTHNTIVYYVLATTTTTEITDTELISQLNSIELLEGLNNVSVSSADLPGEITIHYNYTEEQTIDDLLFCGVVKNSGNISLNPREPHYLNIQILDFKTFLSEGELDSFVIYQKTILEAIQMVIANIQDYGFILGNVNILNPSDVIGAYSTKDKTAYDVFNYIADITQSRWTTRLIDENHVAIDFYDPTLMIEGTPINYTQTFFEDNLIDDMTYSYGSNNYRNKQVMTSSQVYSNISQQQSIVANGYQTQFPTEQPIGKINSITSNGIPLTFATFTEKEMGYVADFYYSPGDNYFESEDLRLTGEILIIDYIAIVEGRQIITNPLEIDRINDSTGRKGIISRYEQRNDATTSTELQKIGESYIKYKGTPEIKLKISTRKNIWEVGQRVQFNAPITELDTEYMVRTKKINYISTIDTIFYEYELISSFNSETEINYFDNQRAKASGNIGEGEYISRNIDIESTANIIFYDTETTEVQVVGDNVLNSALNSPFTS